MRRHEDEFALEGRMWRARESTDEERRGTPRRSTARNGKLRGGTAVEAMPER
jgi:hypothetical protein